MALNYPNYPANYQQAVVKKSGGLKWVLITLICILLVSGGISVMVISAIRAKQQAARQIAEEELARADENPSGADAPGAPAPPPPGLVRPGSNTNIRMRRWNLQPALSALKP